MENRPLSTLIIRNLMFSVLNDGEFCRSYSNGYDFFNAGGGTEYNLFRLVEWRAIEKNLIEEQIMVPQSAWGVTGENLFENDNTNFTKVEIERLWESFYMLLNSNVIAPGMYRNSPSLPYFHVTSHGEECLKANGILPYDIDGYLKKINETTNIDEWVKFYVTEALRCYNANCYNSATIMIGLSSERLIELLISEFSNFLGRSEKTLKTHASYKIRSGNTLKKSFDLDIKLSMKISKKYDYFNRLFNSIEDLPSELLLVFDGPSRRVFGDYIRLTRNEVSHPNEVKREPTETLLLFVGFATYCSAMTKLIAALKMS